jgi:hypothetical protein
MSDIPPRVLRETLRDQLATPSSTSGCVDVEMLAAWADGTLSRNERAMIESHAATCARCQAMLAAMARTTPIVATRKWWQTTNVRWLVPIATTAALAVVVWVKSPVGRQARPAAAGSVSAPIAETRTVDAVAAKPPEPEPVERRKATERRRSQLVESAPARAQETPAAPIVSPQREEASNAAARDSAGAREVAPPAKAPAQGAALAPASAQSPTASSAASAPNAVAETVVIAPPQTFAAKAGAFQAIQSPRQDIVWRIVAGTSVERSTDGGVTWQPQWTGAAVRLTAGAAPSPRTCWLVGAGGVVLVSQDGQTWHRVAFPEPIDLTAVRAIDGSNATVTAADGRAFSTTDGGKTWR